MQYLVLNSRDTMYFPFFLFRLELGGVLHEDHKYNLQLEDIKKREKRRIRFSVESITVLSYY